MLGGCVETINNDKDEDSSNVAADRIDDKPNILPEFFDVFRKQCIIDKPIYMSILENRFVLHVESPTQEINTSKSPDSCSSNRYVTRWSNKNLDETRTEISEDRDKIPVLFNGINDSFHKINYVYADKATTYEQITDSTEIDHCLVENTHFASNSCLKRSNNINDCFLSNGNIETTNVHHKIGALSDAMVAISDIDRIVNEKEITDVSGNNYNVFEKFLLDETLSVGNESEKNDINITSGPYIQVIGELDESNRGVGTINKNVSLSEETACAASDNHNIFKKIVSNKNNNEISHTETNNITIENANSLFEDHLLVDNLDNKICAEIGTDLLDDFSVPKTLGEHKQTTPVDDIFNMQYKQLKHKQNKPLNLRRNDQKAPTRQQPSRNKKTIEYAKENVNPAKRGRPNDISKYDIENDMNQSVKENLGPVMLKCQNRILHNDDQKKKKRWKRQPNETCTCPICHKTYSCVREKRRHIKRHSGEKNYMCMICETPFFSKPELRRHFVKHSKERPFKCEKCDKTYCHYPSKVKHIKTKHRI